MVDVKTPLIDAMILWNQKINWYVCVMLIVDCFCGCLYFWRLFCYFHFIFWVFFDFWVILIFWVLLFLIVFSNAGKEYLNSNFEPGRDIEEAIVPSRMGYTKETLLSYM